MKRRPAFIYTRVSSIRQVKEGHGLESQEERCRKYAESQGYEVIDVFKEEGITGGLFERDAMKRLLTALENYDTNDANNKAVAIFDDLKRFARDVEVHFKLKQEIYSRNAVVESPNFKFEDTPEGKFVETVIAATGALERDQNKRQVMQKMKARLEMGYWPFMPPLALKNKHDSAQGKVLSPHEPYASVLKIALEKYANGAFLTQEEVRQCLHEEFEKRGLPNRPTLSTTQQILKNPLYAGYIEYKRWGILFKKARHNGIIDISTYDSIQDRLLGRTKPWKRRDFSVLFPLRLFVVCNNCNTPLTASTSKGRSNYYSNYFCRSKECKYKWKVIPKYKLETEFEQLLKNKKPADEDIDLTLEILKEQWEIRWEGYSKNRQQLRRDLNETTDSVSRFADRASNAKDESVVSIYENKIKELTKKQKSIEEELKKTQYTSNQFGTASEKVFNTLKKPMDMWQSDQYDDKRMIIYMYFEDKLKYDYKEGFGTAHLAYPIKLICSLGQAKYANVEMSGMTRSPKKNNLEHLQAYPTLKIRFAVSCRTE